MPTASQHRVAFTDRDRDFIIQYLAKYTSGPQGRSGNEIWKNLVENKTRRWPWSNRHTWQSWRDHYVKDRDWFDRKVQRYRQKHYAEQPVPALRPTPKPAPTGSAKRERVPFIDEDDGHLAAYLARHSLSTEGRLGNRLYQTLVENTDIWKWAVRHPWASWRERYKNKKEHFDEYIARYQLRYPQDEILETPAGPRRRKRADKRQVPAVSEQDEAEGVEQDPEAAEEEQEVQEAVLSRDSARGSSGSGGEVEGMNGKRRRGIDHSTSTRTEKRRRVQDNGEGPGAPSIAVIEDDAGEQRPVATAPADQSKANGEGDSELVVQAELGDHTKGALPSDKGNESSDTEEEDDEPRRDRPQIAAVEEEDEEEEDELAPSIDSADEQARMDVDGQQQRPEEKFMPASHNVTPSFAVDRGRMPPGQLYPSLPSPPPPIAEDADLRLPGHFPATSTPIGRRGVSVMSEAIPLPEELLQRRAEESQSKVSQAPTPPASSPPAEAQSVRKQSKISKPQQRASATPGVPQAGPSNVTDATPRARPKAKKLVRKPEEDIFSSVTTTPVIPSSRELTPSRSQAGQRRPREPPRLVEGPFNHVFTDAMGRRRLNAARTTGVAVDEDEDERDDDEVSVWPPVRGRNKIKEKERVAPSVLELPPAARDAEVSTEHNGPATVLHGHPTKLSGRPVSQHHPFSQPTQEWGMTQISQLPQAQSQHHPFSQPSQYMLDGPADRPSAPRAGGSVSKPKPLQPFRLPQAHLDRLEQELNRNGHLLHARAHAHDDPEARPVTGSSSAQLAPSRQKISEDISPKPRPSTFLHSGLEETRIPVPGRGVRFDPTVRDPKGKGRQYPPSTPYPKARRYTIGGDDVTGSQEDAQPVEARVRARKSLPLLPSALGGVRSADDSFVGMSSMSIAFRRPRRRESLSFINQPRRSTSLEPEPAIQISEADEDVVVHIGMETAIQTMSENHGFNPDIVRRVWGQTQSLQKTDAVLRQMREAAERAALQLMEDFREIGEDEAGVELDIGRNMPKRSSTSSSANWAPTRSSHNRGTSLLRFIPVPADPETTSQYSPPRPTRAGQFARLVKEGRKDEARAREASYAGGVSPLKTPQRDNVEHAEQEEEEDETSSDDIRHQVNAEREAHDSVQDIAVGADDALSGRAQRNSDPLLAARITMGKMLGRMIANVNP